MRILQRPTAALRTTFQTHLTTKIVPIRTQYLAKLAPTTRGPVHPPRRIGYDQLLISWAGPHGAEYWVIIGVFSTGWGRPARFLLVSARERPGETPGNQTVDSVAAAPAPASWTPSASGRATNASDMLQLILRKQPFSRGADSDDQRLKIMRFSTRPTEILRRFPCHGSRDGLQDIPLPTAKSESIGTSLDVLGLRHTHSCGPSPSPRALFVSADDVLRRCRDGTGAPSTMTRAEAFPTARLRHGSQGALRDSIWRRRWVSGSRRYCCLARTDSKRVLDLSCAGPFYLFVGAFTIGAVYRKSEAKLRCAVSFRGRGRLLITIRRQFPRAWVPAFSLPDSLQQETAEARRRLFRTRRTEVSGLHTCVNRFLVKGLGFASLICSSGIPNWGGDSNDCQSFPTTDIFSLCPTIFVPRPLLHLFCGTERRGNLVGRSRQHYDLGGGYGNTQTGAGYGANNRADQFDGGASPGLQHSTHIDSGK
ncbi:hypothetical protein DFH09DRAFT_1091754 [Mycena vulgaris]|nr:hypothetical protein DFH09DRAFT_1091754 [Mycena vulgaris]